MLIPELKQRKLPGEPRATQECSKNREEKNVIKIEMCIAERNEK